MSKEYIRKFVKIDGPLIMEPEDLMLAAKKEALTRTSDLSEGNSYEKYEIAVSQRSQSLRSWVRQPLKRLHRLPLRRNPFRKHLPNWRDRSYSPHVR